jgi:hypothetical protein
MTVAELKKLIRKLPNDMDVFIEMPEDMMITACLLQSEVEDIGVPKDGFEDIHPEELEDYQLEIRTVLVLRACSCGTELEKGEINSQPEMN